MRKFRYCILLIFALFLCGKANADAMMDSLFLQNSSTTDSSKTGLESGRYKSIKTQKNQKSAPTAKQKQKNDSASEDISYNKSDKVELVSNFKALKKKKRSLGKRPASESAPSPIPACIPSSQFPDETQKELETIYNEPPITEMLKDLYQGGPNKISEKYKEQLHFDDIRNNKLEIDVGTGFFYDSSVSSYSYRNYYTLAQTLRAGGHVWITPLVGISGVYESTFGESVASTTNSNSFASKSTWLEFSYDIRKFFGASRRANSIQYGITLSQYKFDLQNANATRASLATTGFGVYLNSRIPVAPSYAWTFGFEIFPILSHAESSGSLNLASGSSNTTSRIGVSAGGEIKFSRSSQVNWTLGVKMERNQYSGSATLLDPSNNATPSGVNVTNTWSYLNLGYRWGQ